MRRNTQRYSNRDRYSRYTRTDVVRRRINILMLLFMLALFVTCAIAIKSYTDTNVYQNKFEFKNYAAQEFESRQFFKITGQHKADYEYDKPISYAIDYDTYQNEEINAFRDSQIETIKADFTEEATKQEADLEKEKGASYKPRAHALLVSTEIFETENGVINVAIHESKNIEKAEDMEKVSSDMHTYQFSKKTGEALIPYQIFSETYREKCAAYFTDYFSKKYDEDDFVKGWQDYLTPVESNFNQFVVTENGVTFFFDEGTVLKKSKGVVYAGIPATELGDILRADIIQRYIDPSKPMVALTYDDGPGREAEARILTCLEAHNSVATFFYQGYRVSGNEEMIKRAQNMGCELGNHTWNHPVLTKLTPEQVAQQITSTNQAIYAASGAYPTVFRPSYGATNGTVNTISGLPVIMWTIDTRDWESKNGQAIYNHVVGSGNLDGKIILLHSIHDFTADATEMLVPWLKAQGYQMVTVTELITYKTGAPPQAGVVYR